LIISGITLVLCVILLILNRSSRIPKNLIGWIFVAGMIVVIALSDAPRELTNGRSILAWAVPITLSVIVLPPAAVFVVDVIITVLFWYFGGFQWAYFQYFTLFTLYFTSLMSWLGMSIAERAIRDARNEARKNAAILEGVAEGVIVLAPHNRIVLANRVASELVGAGISKITATTENVEIGRRALSFHWSDVQGVGQVAIVRDISRQVEIDRARDAILRVVSHEMRTPLAAILGFAEVLESRPVPGMATRIRANAQRMLKLVNDLLDVAQLQAGVLTVYPENFPPASLVTYIQENFLRTAGEKGVVLDAQVLPGVPEQVTGDIRRLEQMSANLVDNAIKFTPEGGRVEVRLSAESEGNWQIVVTDTGMGIPPERLPDVFEPFRRASDFARRKHQGVGLGLSIVKTIVQLSGGSISVESTVGKGSTFTVTLPIHGGG
jgi:signal transduction histidine kinase